MLGRESIILIIGLRPYIIIAIRLDISNNSRIYSVLERSIISVLTKRLNFFARQVVNFGVVFKHEEDVIIIRKFISYR